VSFFMDVSSEMVAPVVPLFLTANLGASPSIVGLIEGLAETAASLLKLCSGLVADRFGHNKRLLLLGYGLSAASRPLLAVATGWGLVLTARFWDRVGKGLRTAPRDALITAFSRPEQLGLAFGIHRALDTAGAVIGPTVALLILTVWPAAYRLVFWASLVPGLVSVALIAWLIEADGQAGVKSAVPGWSLRGFEPRLWSYLIGIGLFSLGQTSTAFLILKAKLVGLSPASIATSYLIYTILAAMVAVPAGLLADRFGPRRMLVAGLGLFAAVSAGVAMAATPWQIAGLFACSGLCAGLLDCVQRANLAMVVPPERRATGFGLYHLIVGLMVLPANLLAGVLWETVEPAAPFWASAGLALLATGVLCATARTAKPRSW
jgi:MFS family permease